jgi:hypothetical protein
MAIDEKQLRTCLMQQPRPARIMVKTLEGDAQEVAGVGKGGATWAGVARNIMALNPHVVELYDKDSVLLRAVNAEQAVVEIPRAPLMPDHPGSHAGYSVGSIPPDPETARFIHVSNLVAEAYRFATTIAFDRLARLAETQTERAQALEQRLEIAESNYRRERTERAEDLFEEADAMREAAQRGDADGARNILEGFLSQFTAGRAAAANGAKS